MWRQTGDTVVGRFGSPFERGINESLNNLRFHLKRMSDRVSNELQRIGPKAHPAVTGQIKRIILYVREKTGQYHDSELAEVIAAAIGEPPPRGYPRFNSAEALKVWRSEHGISDQRRRGKPKVSEI
jgi:hypothetical protein